jgi:threonine/homoserine/homoserine lactone efflux protein
LKTYLTFAGATILNPPTALYFLAIAPTLALGTEVDEATWVPALVFAIGVFVGSLIWQQTLAGGGVLMRKLSGEQLQAWTGIIGGLLILALAILIAIKGLA